jgi:hypothetical protein
MWVQHGVGGRTTVHGWSTLESYRVVEIIKEKMPPYHALVVVDGAEVGDGRHRLHCNSPQAPECLESHHYLRPRRRASAGTRTAARCGVRAAPWR